MAETEQTNNWYRDYKEKQLDIDIKKCKTFAIVSGTVAALSSLVVAGNIAIGNGLEVLQVGGTTAAMVSYLIGYSRQKSIYEKEQKELKESEPKSFARERLASLKHDLEINQALLGMDYLVAVALKLRSVGTRIVRILSPLSIGRQKNIF